MPQPTAAPPGWYGDTQSSVPLLRFWDGNRWTKQTRLPDGGGSATPVTAATAGTAGGPTPQPPRRWWQAVKWGAVAAFVLVTAVVGVALWRGQVVCSVNTKGEIVFVGKGEQCVSKTELAKAQQTLTDQLATTKADAAAAPVPTTLPDLNGKWSGPYGITYVITQGGSNATIEEITPGLGLTATGVGTVTQEGGQLQFRAYNGSTGFATYVPQGPNALSSVVTNTTLGTQTPMTLTRVG